MSLKSATVRLPHILKKPVRSSLSSRRSPHISSRITPLSTSRRSFSAMSSSPPKVAVIHQTIQAPVIDGSRKPVKPGGYKDSGADIAFNVSRMKDISVITPVPSPDPAKDTDWVFPDSEEGILAAIESGATHIWANTVLFSSHPLQTSDLLAAHAPNIRIIGQPPTMVEKYDNKEAVNAYLRRTIGAAYFPAAWRLPSSPEEAVAAARGMVHELPFPIVAKPVRGRGSYGVKACDSPDVLLEHIDTITRQSSAVMLEQFLAGEEATVAVLPPTGTESYRALPVVRRFNHTNGVAPYSGLVAVTANSEAVVGSDDPAYEKIQKTCAKIAEDLGFTAPVRIDVRRFEDKPGSEFAVFDVNTKPNMTGPGRPGRDDQLNLVSMAAGALGWSYQDLLRRLVSSARTLQELRDLRPKALE